jgi:hypothetical protein
VLSDDDECVLLMCLLCELLIVSILTELRSLQPNALHMVMEKHLPEAKERVEPSLRAFRLHKSCLVLLMFTPCSDLSDNEVGNRDSDDNVFMYIFVLFLFMVI